MMIISVNSFRMGYYMLSHHMLHPPIELDSIVVVMKMFFFLD